MNARNKKCVVASLAACAALVAVFSPPCAFAVSDNLSNINTHDNVTSEELLTGNKNTSAENEKPERATNDSTTSLTIGNVMPGDKFEAVRIIETSIDGNNGLVRKFADGFSYGTNATSRDDNGLEAYSNLTNAEAIADASEALRRQITDKTVKYISEENDGKAVFEDLPMGQYLVNGYSADGRYIIHNMIATVEPEPVTGLEYYSLAPATIIAKNDNNDNPPLLVIDKTVSKKSYTKNDANPEYVVNVKQTSATTSAHNLYVSDKLDDEAIVNGLRINRDVSMKYADGRDVVNAQIQYENNADGRPIGFNIYIPGEFKPDNELIVTYTGDISTVENHQKTLVNVAKTHADDIDEVTDEENIEYDYDDMLGTGDKIPYVVGSVTAIALVGGAIVLARRKLNAFE